MPQCTRQRQRATDTDFGIIPKLCESVGSDHFELLFVQYTILPSEHVRCEIAAHRALQMGQNWPDHEEEDCVAYYA